MRKHEVESWFVKADDLAAKAKERVSYRVPESISVYRLAPRSAEVEKALAEPLE